MIFLVSFHSSLHKLFFSKFIISPNEPLNKNSVIITGFFLFLKSTGLYPMNLTIDG